MIEDFEPRWRDILADGTAATREVDATTPLRMIFGVDALGRPMFFVIVHQKPGLPRLAGAVSVERRIREKDKTWTLTLALEVPQLTEVFIALVIDLAERCSRSATEAAALATLLETVDQWQTLLSDDFDRLSEERLRGLMAELWFGFRSAHHGRSLREAVTAWSGPFGGEQDFVFATPLPSYEVKAVRPNRDAVKINSERQLDTSPLQLAVITMDRSLDASGWDLPSLVAVIRDSLDEPEARVAFNRALVETRVNLADPWYTDQKFTFHRLRAYDVRPEFPAIRATRLPDGLSRTKYRLDLTYLDDFLMLDRELADEQGTADAAR